MVFQWMFSSCSVAVHCREVHVQFPFSEQALYQGDSPAFGERCIAKTPSLSLRLRVRESLDETLRSRFRRQLVERLQTSGQSRPGSEINALPGVSRTVPFFRVSDLSS